jgi:NADH-quinone oxidoreductase subunit C
VALTLRISGLILAERLSTALGNVVIEATEGYATIPAERVVEASRFLRDDPDLDCKFLNSLTAIDWIEHFEIVYHLSSLAKNHTLVLKARASHESPVVPSVSQVWQGANLQEREAYDLMGIGFSGHPSLKRIFLWEGFPGHPLRKDFLALPGGFKPGLQRFPFEFPEGQHGYPALDDTQAPAAPSVPRLDQPPPPPFPITDAGRQPQQIAETVRHEEAAGLQPEQRQGAGPDPARAGGTAADPSPSVEAAADEEKSP